MRSEAGSSIMVLAQREVLRAASRNCDSPKIKPSLLSADVAIAFLVRWSHPCWFWIENQV